jgi:hypothetical protein
MDLANMREQGVTHLVAFCHNDALSQYIHR